MGKFPNILVMLVKLSAVLAAPLQFPLLQPLPGTWQQQQLALQEQMLALQQFQDLQKFNAIPTPVVMNQQQPLLVLIPNVPLNIEKVDRFTKVSNNHVTKNKPNTIIESDDDIDSITIDADPEEPSETENTKETSVRAILLLPNRARFSIGGFISSLPWLPIEINVPDSISWIYEGISGIISGIGQSWPFNRPQNSESQNGNKKTIWNNIERNNMMPIVVMPLTQPMLPIQG